jgi:phasin family protein
MSDPIVDLPEAPVAENIPPVLAAATPRRARVKAARPVEPSAPDITAPEPAPPVSQADEPAPPAAAPADPQEEAVMATTIENATDTAQSTFNDAAGRAQAQGQAMFGEMNSRAKAAMERSAKAWEEMNALTKGNIEAMMESGRIMARGLEAMGQDAAEYTRKSVEATTEAARTLAAAKSPTEFVKLQGDFVRASFDRVVAETSRNTETALKLAGEVAQPLSNRVAVAAEKMRAVA